MTRQDYPDFSSSFVVERRTVRPRNPILVAGLPGIGFVSKLAVDHLVKNLGAKKIATLYSPYFPNQVVALKSGRLRLFSTRFFYKQCKSADIIFVKGDLQPLTVEGQYEVSGKILSYFKALGGSEVLAMAGYAINSSPEQPAIYCTSTSKKKLGEYLKMGARKGNRPVPIVGMAGLLPGLARLYGMDGTCLLVETPGHFIDAKGAIALVRLLSRRVGEKFDTSKLSDRARKTEALLKKIGEQAMSADEAQAAVPLTSAELLKRGETLSYIR